MCLQACIGINILVWTIFRSTIARCDTFFSGFGWTSVCGCVRYVCYVCDCASGIFTSETPVWGCRVWMMKRLTLAFWQIPSDHISTCTHGGTRKDEVSLRQSCLQPRLMCHSEDRDFCSPLLLAYTLTLLFSATLLLPICVDNDRDFSRFW